MTQEQEVWITTLNLFGSDIEPAEIQAALDKEHAKADPEWGAMYRKREACTT